ncbi:hypothetical protein B0J14DRAFT_695313 [Halenospora varia]|nr:hypothetical protein B0J14DRAFT_695313 [Halenospora varia]
MHFKNVALVAILAAITNAAAIPADLNAREPAELYGCASNTKRDIFGRCPEKREPEPTELYGCASNTKRDIHGRCPEKREPEPAELYGCASNTKRDIHGRCPEAAVV